MDGSKKNGMKKANYFDLIYIPDKNRDRFWEVFTKFLQRFIPENSSVLDIGAGYCCFINNVKAREKCAIDREDISRYANKGIRLLQMDCHKITKNALGKTYHVVMISNFLEHIPKEEIYDLLKRVHSICKRIIILGPNYQNSYRYYWDDPTHQTALSHTTMVRILIGLGYEIEKVYPEIIPFSVQGKPGSPLPYISKFLIKAYLYSPIKPFAGQMLVIAKPKAK